MSVCSALHERGLTPSTFGLTIASCPRRSPTRCGSWASSRARARRSIPSPRFSTARYAVPRGKSWHHLLGAEYVHALGLLKQAEAAFAGGPLFLACLPELVQPDRIPGPVAAPRGDGPRGGLHDHRQEGAACRLRGHAGHERTVLEELSDHRQLLSGHEHAPQPTSGVAPLRQEDGGAVTAPQGPGEKPVRGQATNRLSRLGGAHAVIEYGGMKLPNSSM